MLEANCQAILTDILKRESASLLSYTADAFPWTTAKAAPALDALRGLVANHAKAVDALGRFLVKQKVATPQLGAYPSYYTYLNFLSLKHLLPKLIASEQELIGQLEQDSPRLSKEAAGPAQALLGAKQSGLAELERIQAGLAS